MIPSILKILNKLDPNIFPIAISVCFLNAAIIDVANSGKEVPIAIIERLITLSETS